MYYYFHLSILNMDEQIKEQIYCTKFLDEDLHQNLIIAVLINRKNFNVWNGYNYSKQPTGLSLYQTMEGFYCFFFWSHLSNINKSDQATVYRNAAVVYNWILKLMLNRLLDFILNGHKLQKHEPKLINAARRGLPLKI